MRMLGEAYSPFTNDADAALIFDDIATRAKTLAMKYSFTLLDNFTLRQIFGVKTPQELAGIASYAPLVPHRNEKGITYTIEVKRLVTWLEQQADTRRRRNVHAPKQGELL